MMPFLRTCSMLVIATLAMATPFQAAAQGVPSPTPAPAPAPAPAPTSAGDPRDFRSLDLDAFALQIENSRAELFDHPDRQRDNYLLASKFASCAYGFSGDRAQILLDQPMPALKARNMTLPQFSGRVRGCFVSNDSMDPDFVRGALAESAIEKSIDDSAYAQAGDVAAIREFMKSVELWNGGPEKPMSKVQMTSECRVGFAPAQARAVIDTLPGSEEEAEKLKLLRAATPQCDPLAPMEDIPALFQRAFAAQALYHWARFRERKAGPE